MRGKWKRAGGRAGTTTYPLNAYHSTHRTTDIRALCGPDTTHLATVRATFHRHHALYGSRPPPGRPHGYFTSITLPNADLEPPRQTTVRAFLPHHQTLCGPGPFPQTTVRVPYADLDLSPDDRTGVLLPPRRPMRIWTSSQTTVRAEYHQSHHNRLPSSGEQHIHGLRPKHEDHTKSEYHHFLPTTRLGHTSSMRAAYLASDQNMRTNQRALTTTTPTYIGNVRTLRPKHERSSPGHLPPQLLHTSVTSRQKQLLPPYLPTSLQTYKPITKPNNHNESHTSHKPNEYKFPHYPER